ncbi:26S proteasome non-ATPase regulatory subunit 12 [Exaiptasia diaphana]|uniref:PCI domain-containing protein n=1 Tax=Exaiptasia diaphana TaxID=2652724 RepID=A0A913Y9K8_EXADI|nr:26S proteasome non-ATPase regulatory subunit 12 [Exaiptasia diaphana]KXJ21702.1 26S proteasome non-ATPase regulatory subunit 12 [Exaiptasia diaphana]
MASTTVTDMKGNVVKMEVDYSDTVDKTIPECEAISAEGKLTEALEKLLSLEKQTRTAADMHSTARLLVCIVQLCFKAKDWNALNENVTLLTKRRSQLKQAVTKMIQEAFSYVDQTPDKETKLKLIDTLRTVSAGKIYLEIERARLTRMLAQIKEDEGDISEAANILQELQVETFGSMERKEKVEFILEQMRLCLAKKDFVRTQIISKKISPKFFENNQEQDLKLKFYQLLIELARHEGSYLATCKYYKAIYDTPMIMEDKDKKHQALRNVVMYLVLSPFDNEQSDLIHRVKEEKSLEEIPLYQELLKCFTTPELMNWSNIQETYGNELRNGSGKTVFDSITDDGNKTWEELRKRVVEHNIRVMAKYYTRITLKRMSELLYLTTEESEHFLSELVVSKTVFARIDRPSGIVTFSTNKACNDILNEWSHNISTLMQLLNRTTHLITKEEMVHKLSQN